VEQVQAAPAPAETQAPRPEASTGRKGRKSKFRGLLVPAVGLTLVVLLGVWFFFFRPGRTEAYTGPTWEVKKDRLQLTIVERGSLESAENSDIVCRVKARSQGNTIATTIKWVIDDGSEVARGQKVVELDDSGLQEQLKTQNIALNNARSSWIQADKNCAIQESQNSSDIETAKVNKMLADLDLCKFAGNTAGKKMLVLKTREDLQLYLNTDFEKDLRAELEKVTEKLNSEFLQTLNDIEGRIEVARADREQALDRFSWSNRMVKRGYVSRSQADADKAKLQSYEISLQKVQGERDIFMKFTLERNATDLWSKVREADRALERVKTQAAARQTTADADRDSKRAIFDQEESKKGDIEEEIRKCLILAPQDGMVVYFVPEQSRFGSGSNQSIIAQGEPVREGQKMIRIPNLTKMQVNVRVHEAMVSKVRGEIRKPTGYGDRLRAAFSVGLTDPLGLGGYAYGFNEVRERDEFRDKEEDVVYLGQKARIQVDAHPGKLLDGRVKNVAAVASQADFLSSDVKVYTTIVSIDGTAYSLKPGMSAEVTILAAEAGNEPVLVIPIQSVLGNVAMGAKRKCFVLDERGIPKERDIEVGMSNDKLVELKGGLAEGEKVVLSPKSLVGEKSGLRAGTPTTRRGADIEDGDGGGKKKGKKGGPGGPGGAMPPGGPGGAMPPGGPGGAMPPGGPGGGAPPRGFNKQ
jgi:multidrug efflux pump subunit AcrA (membrane-fusion protein)